MSPSYELNSFVKKKSHKKNNMEQGFLHCTGKHLLKTESNAYAYRQCHQMIGHGRSLVVEILTVDIQGQSEFAGEEISYAHSAARRKPSFGTRLGAQGIAAVDDLSTGDEAIPRG